MEIAAPDDTGGSVVEELESTRKVVSGEGGVESMADTDGGRVAEVFDNHFQMVSRKVGPIPPAGGARAWGCFIICAVLFDGI
jgi:hypothetical protein